VVLDNLTTRGTLGTRSWSFNPAIDVIESGDYPLEQSHIHRLPLDDIERVLRLQGGVFEDEDALREWQARLRDSGVRVSGIEDRTYFKSIYTSDPDGLTIEFATRGPGFDVNEDEPGSEFIEVPEQ